MPRPWKSNLRRRKFQNLPSDLGNLFSKLVKSVNIPFDFGNLSSDLGNLSSDLANLAADLDVDLVDVDMGGAPEEVAEMPAEMQSVSEFKHPGRCDPVRPANCIAIGICSENDFRDGEGQPAKSTRREFKTVTRCFR